MKKIILLSFITLSLAFNMFSQLSINELSGLSVADIQRIESKLKINQDYKTKLKVRTSVEKFMMDYPACDSIFKALTSGMYEKSFGWKTNSYYDTATLPTSATSGYYSKGIIQGFWELAYLDANNTIKSINIDSATITIDSINPILIYDRTVTTQDDTMYFYVYEDSFNLTKSPSTGFTQDITGVRLAAGDTVILKNSTDLDTYMFRKKVTLSKGNGFLVRVKFKGHIDNAVRGIASYSTNCGTAGDGPALMTDFGYTHLSLVYKPSTGNPFRLSMWNDAEPFTPSTPPIACKKFYHQNWFIFPFISASVEPNVVISSNQSSTTLCKDAQVQLSANATGYSSTSLTYAWSPATGLSATNIANPIATVGTANTIYTVTVTDGITPKTATATVFSSQPALTISASKTNLTNCGETATLTASGTTLTYAWNDANNSTTKAITVNVGKTYSVTATNTVGCSATASVTITTSFTQAVFDYTFSPSTPCANSDITFTATPDKPGWLYTWKDGSTVLGTGNPLVKPLASSKSITLTVDSTPCTSAPVTKSLTLSAGPTLNFSVPTSVCQDKPAKFKVTTSAFRNGWEYSWSNTLNGETGNDTAFTVTFGTAGKVTVTLNADTNSGACKANPKSTPITVLAKTDAKCKSGILNSNLSDQITIFPNPVKDGILNVKNESSNSVSVKVTDLLGKTVSLEKMNGLKTGTVDLSNVSNGVYFVEIESKNDRIVRKVLIDKQ